MNSSANEAFPINFLWFGIIFPIQWPVKSVKSMAMRAVLLVMSLSTCWALRYLQGASDLSQHVKSVGGNSEGEDKGICMDLQGEARQRDSGHLRLQPGEVCDS